MKRFSKSGKVGISVLVVALVALVAIAATVGLLPKFAKVDSEPAPKVVAIIPTNNNEISANANVKDVYVIVKYSNGSEKQVEMSELTVGGLDTARVGEYDNVELVYGGFKQYVRYTVVPTKLVVKYSAPGGGGRIEGDREQMINAGEDGSRVRAIPDEGYEFIRWDDGNPNPSRQEKQVSGNREYIATFAKRVLRVVFQYPDGTLSREQEVQYGNSPDFVPSLDENQMKLKGYRFTHWSKDFSFVTEDMVVVANYEKHSANFHLDITQRDGQDLARIEEPDDFYEMPVPFFEKDKIANVRLKASGGRMFTGWSIRDYKGDWFELPVKKANEDNRIKIEVAKGQNVDFFSAATGTMADEFQLSFTPGAGVDDIYVKANLIYDEPKLTFYSFGEPVLDDEGKQLVVSLRNNLSTTMGVIEREKLGEKFDFTQNALKAKGHVFKGWEYRFEGKTYLVDKDNYSYLEFDQDTDLKAVWEVGVYDVEFRREDNEDPGFADPQKGYDSLRDARILRVKYQNSLNNVENEGVFPDAGVKKDHVFKGWFANKAEGPVSITLNTILDEEGLVAYPVFEVKKVSLSIEVTGPGKVREKLQDQSGSWYLGDEVLSTKRLEVDRKHVFCFIAAKDHYISSLEVDGISIDVGTGAESYDLEIDKPSKGMVAKAVFTMFNASIKISNGDAQTSGTIEYLNDIDSGPGGYQIGQRVEATGANISIPSQIDSKKMLSIKAPANHSIFSISIDGTALSGIPKDAEIWSVEVSIGKTDVEMTITYQRIQHSVYVLTPPEALSGGAISIYQGSMDKGLNARFDKGCENAIIRIGASEGKYVKSVRANGYVLNPYADHSLPTTRYLGKAIEVNYEPADLSAKDERVSAIDYQIRIVDEDVAIDVEYADMFYQIETSCTGTGNISPSSKAGYGTTVHVNADTGENNYVVAVYANDKMIKTQTNSSTYTYTIDSIKEDYEVRFEFAPRTYGVSFEPDGNLSLKHKDELFDLEMGKTFTLLQRGENLEFEAIADDNYEISSISFKTRGDDSWSALSIPYNLSRYVIKIDDIGQSYEYRVKTIPRKAKYVIKAVSGTAVAAAPEVSIGGETIDFGSYEFSYQSEANYGGELAITVVGAGLGYVVPGFSSIGLPSDLDFAKVLNSADADFTYEYYPSDQTMPSGPCYTIVRGDNGSGVGYDLIINNVASDMEIVLSFEKSSLGTSSPYSIDYRASYYVTPLDSSSGTRGTIAAYDKSDNAISPGSTVAADDGASGPATVKYVITPDSSYAVKAVSINGIVVASYGYADALAGMVREITHAAASDQNLEVVFVKNKNKLTLVETVGMKGSLSSRLAYYENTDSVKVKVTPDIGYEIDGIVIKPASSSASQYEIKKPTIMADPVYISDGVYEFNVEDLDPALLDYDLSIEARFTPKKHTLQVSSTGQGAGEIKLYKGADSVSHALAHTSYDENYELRLEATGDSYIKTIVVNGFEYDISLLDHLVHKPNNIERYSSGTYAFKISGDMTIEVRFEREEYYLRLVGSENGTVDAKVEKEGYSTPYLSLDKIVLYSTDVFSVIMKASYGYNVRRLLINNEVVWENLNPNLILSNQQCDRVGIVLDQVAFGSIINVEAEFEINQYYVKIDAVNSSPNFKYVDVNPSEYGTIAISGRGVEPSGTYQGFSHGSNVRIDLRPRVGRGYYISKFKIRYADVNLGEQDLTSEIVNPNGDSYLIRNISCNVISVVVEYQRRTYSFEYSSMFDPLQSIAKYKFEGSMEAPVIYNPYDKSLEVFEIEGKYEYGLGYEIALDPGVGYERDSFVVNGVDRLSAVRGHKFKGIISENVYARSLFKIKQYRIDIDYAIGQGGELIVEDSQNSSYVVWNEGKANEEDSFEITTGTVRIGFDSETGRSYLMATHASKLNFRIIPRFDQEGSRISRILKGSSLVSFADGEREVSFIDGVSSKYTLRVEFEKSLYQIKYHLTEGVIGVVPHIVEETVEWGAIAKIRLVIDPGYYLAELGHVKSLQGFDDPIISHKFISQFDIDGQKGSYTQFPPRSDNKQYIEFSQPQVKSPITFVVKVIRCKFDITLEKDYDVAYTHNAEEYKASLRIKTNEYNPNHPSNEYGTDIAGTIVKQSGSANNVAKVKTIGLGSEYIGLSYEDQVGITFFAPCGYDIDTISVTMSKFGLIENLVTEYNPSNPSNKIIRKGLYEYYLEIPKATGDISASVTYKIRSYQLKQVPMANGIYSANTTSTAVEHHSEFQVEIIADYGYYLEEFYIYEGTNRVASLEKAKTSIDKRYAYSTTRSGIRMRISDDLTGVEALLDANGNYEIPIRSVFNTLKYDIDIYVKQADDDYKLVSNPEITMLKVSYEGNQIVFDSGFSAFDLDHVLEDGTEVSVVSFYNQNRNNLGISQVNDIYSLNRTNSIQAVKIDEFISASPSSALLEEVGRGVLDILDFHNDGKDKIFLYYDVRIKRFDISQEIYYVSSQGNAATGYISKGEVVDSVPDATFVFESSDNLPGANHAYGVGLTYTATVGPESAKKVQFVGFQEKIGGKWQYLGSDSGIVTGEGNNRTLSLEVTRNRQFRAVFYQVFVVNVFVMPSYAPTSANPTLYNFMRYETSLKAIARYDKSEADGRILPYVEKPIDSSEYLEEELNPINVGSQKINYEFLVKSGSKLKLSADQGLNASFFVVKESASSYNEEQIDDFKPSSDGYVVNRQYRVNMYTVKNAYMLLERETVGGILQNEGGRIRYKVADGQFTNLSSSYIAVTNNSTVEIEITVNDNYRFEELSAKASDSPPTAEGRLVFGQDEPISTGDDEKRITVSYENATGPVSQVPQNAAEKRAIKKIYLRITNFSYQKAVKVKFIKQIRVFKYSQLLRDGYSLDGIEQMDSQGLGPVDSNAGNKVFSGQETVTQSVYFDFGTELEYQLVSEYRSVVSDIYRRPLQFAGFMVNGVNLEKNLSQGYPDPAARKKIVLDDMDSSLETGVKFDFETNIYSGAKKEYVVKIVAKFIPALNVLFENAYENEPGVYVDTGNIAVTTVMFNEDNVETTPSSQFVESQYHDSSSSQTIYTNKLMKIPGKVNGSSSNYQHGYNIWSDNTITLDWISQKDRKSIAFVEWEYYAYNPNSSSADKFEWVPIGYVGEENGRPTSSKDARYTFPISAIIPQVQDGSNTYRPYYYYSKADGSLLEPSGLSSTAESSFGFDNIAMYDAGGSVIPGRFLSSYPVIRIRPKFEKRVYVEIASYLCKDEENVFDRIEEGVSGELVNPTVGGSGLSSVSLSLGEVTILKPNTFTDNYEFSGWFYRPRKDSVHNSLVALDNVTTTVPFGNSTRSITYKYLATSADLQDAINDGLMPAEAAWVDFDDVYKDTLALKLDWPDGDYLIGAEYTKLYDIVVNVENESGSTIELLNNSRPELDYYGIGSVGDSTNWSVLQALSGRPDEYTVSLKVPAGKILMFKLNTKYVAGNTNPLNDNVFNPKYDEFAGVEVFENGNTFNNTWATGSNSDMNHSIDVISPGTAAARDVSQIEGTKYAIFGNADKQVKVKIKSYGTLTLHNVYDGAEVKLPEELAQIVNNEIAGSGSGTLNNELIKDNGPFDSDSALGVIRIERIPIRPYIDIDGKRPVDFGVKITQYLQSGNVIASENFQHGITLDGTNSKLRKEQHVIIYETKSIPVFDLSTETVTNVTMGKGLEKPFAGGDGTSTNPFIIMTTYQFKQIDSLFIGNQYTLEFGNGTDRFRFKLGADIDLRDAQNPVTEPMCLDEAGINGFNGVLDGDGNKLYGLSINMMGDAGLFARLTDGAELRKLNIGADEVYSVQGNAGFFAGEARVYDKDIVIEEISFAGSPHTFGYYHGKAVGGLVGLVHSASGKTAKLVLRGIEMENGLVESSGTTYPTGMFDDQGLHTQVVTAAAGGAIGILRSKYLVERVQVKSFTVKSTQSSSDSRFAGGFAGIVDSDANSQGVMTGVRVCNPSVMVSVSYAGGIVGALGRMQTLSGSVLAIEGEFSSIKGRYSGLVRGADKQDEYYKNHGVGGAVGINLGKIQSFSFEGSGTIRLDGTVAGGIAGINDGEISNCSSVISASSNIKLRMPIEYLTSGVDRDGGGFYGGVAGINSTTGTIEQIEISSSAYPNYLTTFGENTAFLEVANLSKFSNVTSAYDVHKDLLTHAAVMDDSNVYIGGIVGHNFSISSNSIKSAKFATKLMVYRESSAAQSSSMYVNSIGNGTLGAGCSFTGRIEIMRHIVSDNMQPDPPESTPALSDPATLYDHVNSGSNPSGGTAIVRYLTLGSYYVKARSYNAIPPKKALHSTGYGYSKVRLAKGAGVSVDNVCSQTIDEPGSGFSIQWDSKDLAQGKVEVAGGNLPRRYNYIGHIRQTRIS